METLVETPSGNIKQDADGVQVANVFFKGALRATFFAFAIQFSAFNLYLW